MGAPDLSSQFRSLISVVSLRSASPPAELSDGAIGAALSSEIVLSAS
jgi:hypothetical protein